MSDSPSKPARVSLPATEYPPPPQASETGAMPADQMLSVTVITRRRKPLALHELDGRIISREEFDQSYAGLPEDFDALRQFAHEHGLSVDEANTSLPRRSIALRGPASRLEQAFGTALHTFQHVAHHKHFHAYKGALSLPEDIAPRVEAVLGLDTRPIAKAHIRRLEGQHGAVRANAAGASFTPVQVASLYDFPKGLTGAGETIGLIELGGGYEASDVSAYFKSLGLQAPAVVAVAVDGGANVPGGDPQGADGEVALDIQVAGAVAPGAKIAVYFAPNTDQGFIDAITTAVHDTANKPSVISISWGGPETTWSATSRTALDNACQSAGALGITVTVASGDSGSSDGQSGSTVDFPAASPHVLACGGTKLTGSGASISAEVVWNDQPSGGASGGGVSKTFALPSWQANAGVPKGGRGVPDVAGDAAPASGYQVLVDGARQVVGGTSAVAPLWAGLVALLNEQRAKSGGAPVGFLNPHLYGAPADLRDITTGSNGAYQAKQGWDACTGLGSPNGAALAQLFGGGGASTGSGGGGAAPAPPTQPTPPAAPKPPTKPQPPKHKKHHH